MTKKPVAQPQDKYVLRLPDGLRDRIKAYAERHGRSMNTEIVRILEREFPEPELLENRVTELLDMLDVFKHGANNDAIERFIEGAKSTLGGIYAGRVLGVSDEQRRAISVAYERWEEEQARQSAWTGPELDPEEAEMRRKSGGTAKLVVPKGETT